MSKDLKKAGKERNLVDSWRKHILAEGTKALDRRDVGMLENSKTPVTLS